MHWSLTRLNTLLLMLLVLMAGAIIAILASRAGAGPLDPPGPPSSTLPQVEPRMPIPPVGWNGTFPITISQPGSYFLTKNLTGVSGQDGIDINTPNVALDLSGFTLTGVSGALIGIHSASAEDDIIVRNGIVRSWPSQGISMPSVTRSRFEDLTVTDNNDVGLIIGSGNQVLRVIARNNGAGLEITQAFTQWAGSVVDSDFSVNAGVGLYINANNVSVRRSVIDSNGTNGVSIIGSAGYGSWCEVSDSRVVNNGSYGLEFGGNRNVVVRNHIDGNTSGGVHNLGAGNIVGPLYPLGSTTDPEANTGF